MTSVHSAPMYLPPCMVGVTSMPCLLQVPPPDHVGSWLSGVGSHHGHGVAGHAGGDEDGEHSQSDRHAPGHGGQDEGGAVLPGAVGRHRVVGAD